jgi:predicted DNA-binding transcriptional regulator AlpA
MPDFDLPGVPPPAPLPRDVLAAIAAVVAETITALPPADPAGTIRPELLTREQAAAFLAIGLTALSDLDARGFLPSPVRLGDGARLVRYSRAELVAWVAAGCPARAKWNVIKAAAGAPGRRAAG